MKQPNNQKLPYVNPTMEMVQNQVLSQLLSASSEIQTSVGGSAGANLEIDEGFNF